MFILIIMVSVIEIFLLVPCRRKGWVVNRRLRSLDTMLTVWGRTKLFYLIQESALMIKIQINDIIFSWDKIGIEIQGKL